MVGVCRRPPVVDQGLYARPSWVALDLAEATTSQLTGVLRGADALIHLAWQIQPGRRRELQHRVNVEGTRSVLRAAADAGVGQLVVASSVGTYAPVHDDLPRDETWPASGIASSTYSSQKAAVERLLDDAVCAGLRLARLRPALVFQRAAGAQIARYFLGPFLPTSALRWGLPVLPAPADLRLQVVASADVADAYVRALLRGATGAFNVAADDLLEVDDLARLLSARHVPLRWPALRSAADLSFRAGLQPTEAGWLDMAHYAPVMSTAKVRDELGWRPEVTASAAVQQLLGGMVAGTGTASQALRPRSGVVRRLRQLRAGPPGSARLP